MPIRLKGMHMQEQTSAAREKLAADFRAMVADADELLQLTAGQAGDKVSATRERIQQRLRQARTEVDRAEAVALSRAREAAAVTDGYVHAHPWTVAGIAAGAGLLVGMLISRR